MCLAIPAKIVGLEEYNVAVNTHHSDLYTPENKRMIGFAKVEIMGIVSAVNIVLIENPKIGDYVLIHAGCAIQKIDTDYFEYLQGIFWPMMEVQQNDEQTGFN